MCWTGRKVLRFNEADRPKCRVGSGSPKHLTERRRSGRTVEVGRAVARPPLASLSCTCGSSSHAGRRVYRVIRHAASCANAPRKRRRMAALLARGGGGRAGMRDPVDPQRQRLPCVSRDESRYADGSPIARSTSSHSSPTSAASSRSLSESPMFVASAQEGSISRSGTARAAPARVRARTCATRAECSGRTGAGCTRGLLPRSGRALGRAARRRSRTGGAARRAGYLPAGIRDADRTGANDVGVNLAPGLLGRGLAEQAEGSDVVAPDDDRVFHDDIETRRAIQRLRRRLRRGNTTTVDEVINKPELS
jgi:hypothetical protein